MEKSNRKPNRLSNFNYGEPGCYFVTLCTHNRWQLFFIDSASAQNEPLPIPLQNQIIHKWIRETQNKYPNITIDKYVIMPDHVHLIVTIKEEILGITLPDAMRFFKTMTTNEYIRGVKCGQLPPFDKKLWQKSYYDHVIRNQQDYNDAWVYIEDNPDKWMREKVL